MTAPATSTPWVPLWSFQDPSVVPTPVDGKWLKGGPGGSMVWSDIPGLVAADTSWTIPTLLNGWVQYADPYGPVRFRKLASGLVVINGLMASGTAGATAFTLPVGYRPGPQVGGGARDHIYQCAVGGGVQAEACRIHSNGDVRPQGAATSAWIDMSGCMFWAGG
jgi:hypothetical protein